MKIITLLLFCLFLTISIVSAQQKAVTDMGEEVILYDDGSWKYQNEDGVKNYVVPTNPEVFKKDDNSTFLLKSSSLNVGFWIDPKVWSFKKATDNPDAEYELQLKGGDLYGMIISERIEIPLESLKASALEIGRTVAPDLKIVKEEYRTVNGLKVLFLQMNGTMQGIKFSYYGYYFSNHNGSVQYITYTSQNLIDDYRETCDKLLNGFVELD